MTLRDAETLHDEPSTLERFFRTLSRGQYVVGSAITGHPLDALENASRLAEELFTGSWLHGYSALDRLVGEQAKSGRPEGADVLRRFGYGIDRGGAGELAANLGIGALLDPLTYVGGIGLGAKAGRLSAKGLIGLAPEALEATLGRAGATSDLLLRAMNAVDAQPVIRRVLAEETGRVAKDPTLLQEALAGFAKAPGPYERDAASGLLRQVDGPRFGPPLTPEQVTEATQSLAARRLGLDAGGRVSFTGTDAQREILEAGIRGLEGQGFIRPAGVPTIEIPGMTWHALPGSADQWSRIGLASPLKALNGILGLASPGAAEWFGRLGTQAQEKLVRTFVDRGAFGAIPDSLRALATQGAGELVDTVGKRLRYVAEATAGLAPDAQRAIGRELLLADDLMRKGVTKEQAEAAAKRIGLDPLAGPAWTDAASNLTPEGKIGFARLEAVRKTLPWLGEGEAADRMRMGWADTRERAIAAAQAVGADPDDAARAIDSYVDAVRQMPQGYVDAGVWARADATPFYFPHQANDLLSLFLASGSPTKKVSGRSYAEALADVFSKGREHANLAETIASFRDVAQRYGVPIPDLSDFAAHASSTPPHLTPTAQLDAVMDTDLAKLWARREVAYAGTMQRAAFEKAARSVVTDVRHATTLDDFLSASLQGIGARGSTLQKLLGGGKIRLEGLGAQLAAKIGAGRGTDEVREVAFPGINTFVKPALYLPGMSTYTRNAVGGVVMGLMDPEIGWSGATGIARMLADLPIVKALGGSGPRDLQAAMLAYATDKADDAHRALLASSTWGGKPALEVAEGMRHGVVGQNAIRDKDLFESLGDVDAFLRESAEDPTLWKDWRAAFTGKGLTSQTTSARGLERYRRFWAPMGRANQAIENGLRSASYLELVKKGYDVPAAIKKVQDTFVDYAYQSGEERLLRDLLPFSRFTVAAGPNAIKGSTSGVGRTVGRAVTGYDDERPLPPEIRRQVSIPVGGNTYATSLGLPFESGGTLLGLIPGAQGFFRNAEQNLLGAAGTPIKPFLEATTGKQFFSDLPLSEVRPIGNLPPFVSHTLFGFLPLSRFRTEVDKWVGTARGDWSSAVNLLSGVKLRTIDSEREAEQVLKRWLENAVRDGRVDSLERFFVGKGREADPEVTAALKALATQERARRAKGTR